MRDILLRSLKVGTTATLGLLGLHGLLLLRGPLRLGSNLVLNSLGIRLTLLSNGTTEALLLGAALRIALATPAKTAASCLGRKGAHDVLIEQLIGIDMLTRSSFFHSRHVSGILDDKIFDGLGRLPLGIADLDIDGIDAGRPLMPLPSILVTIFAAISSSRIALVSHSLSTERKICASALDLILSALRQSRS